MGTGSGAVVLDCYLWLVVIAVQKKAYHLSLLNPIIIPCVRHAASKEYRDQGGALQVLITANEGIDGLGLPPMVVMSNRRSLPYPML